MPGASIQSTGGGGTLIAMSRRTGGRFREWCQCKSVEEIEEMYQGTSVHVVSISHGVLYGGAYLC